MVVHTFLIPVFERQRQAELSELKANQDYKVRPCFKTPNTTKKNE